MTWSIVARDPTGALGIAIASRFFAVGVLCPHARSNVGALSTQALVNPLYGGRGLDLLAERVPPYDVVRRLTEADGGRDHRQVHVVDALGRTAACTGARCIEWCGHRQGEGYSVAGNMLVGSEVISETARAYDAHPDLPFAERLLTALDAGDAAGGDKRGRQAAALIVYTTEEYPALSLRVDDSPQPFSELRRLYDKSFERYQPFVSCLPSRARPDGITDRDQIEREIERFTAARAISRRT